MLQERGQREIILVHVVERGVSTGRSFAPPCLNPKPKKPRDKAQRRQHEITLASVVEGDKERIEMNSARLYSHLLWRETNRGLRRTAWDYTRVCCGGRQREGGDWRAGEMGWRVGEMGQRHISGVRYTSHASRRRSSPRVEARSTLWELAHYKIRLAYVPSASRRRSAHKSRRNEKPP